MPDRAACMPAVRSSLVRYGTGTEGCAMCTCGPCSSGSLLRARALVVRVVAVRVVALDFWRVADADFRGPLARVLASPLAFFFPEVLAVLVIRLASSCRV